jgi:hypothetical protein
MAGGDRHRADSALVAALAAGKTVQDAARVGHVSERTVYRRLADPDFRHELSDARAAMVDRATGRLADAMSGAVEALVGLAEHATSEPARVSAARAVVEFGMRMREVEEFERRLAELEAMALVQRNGHL